MKHMLFLALALGLTTLAAGCAHKGHGNYLAGPPCGQEQLRVAGCDACGGGACDTCGGHGLRRCPGCRGEGCQACGGRGGFGCQACGGSGLLHRHQCGRLLQHRQNMHAAMHAPANPGPLSASITYPYYTNRGPRDYFDPNPRSIGP